MLCDRIDGSYSSASSDTSESSDQNTFFTSKLFSPKKSDKTHKFKMRPNSKTQNVTKIYNSKCDKTQKPKMLQNSKTQNVTNQQLKM